MNRRNLIGMGIGTITGLVLGSNTLASDGTEGAQPEFGDGTGGSQTTRNDEFMASDVDYVLFFDKHGDSIEVKYTILHTDDGKFLVWRQAEQYGRGSVHNFSGEFPAGFSRESVVTFIRRDADSVDWIVSDMTGTEALRFLEKLPVF